MRSTMTDNEADLFEWLQHNRPDVRGLYMLVYGVPTGQIKWEQTYAEWMEEDMQRVARDLKQLVLDCDDSTSKNNTDLVYEVLSVVREALIDGTTHRTAA